MAQNKAVLSDEDFLRSHLSDYLDEDLSAPNRQKFDEIATRLGMADIATDYGIRRGRLQIEAQRLFLSEKKMRAIHELVEDDAARANHEAAEIEEVGMSEMKGNAARFIAMAAFFALIFGGLYYFFKPVAKPSFNALNSLIYEADVMNENSEGRLNFPTDRVEELNGYFAKVPELGFEPKAMKALPADWKVAGGSLIDYDGAKITVTQFLNTTSNEKQYLFFYVGKLEQLPKSNPGNSNGLVYQSYGSSNLNVMAWQAEKDVVGMLIGYRAPKDLADFAMKVVGP
ncbi:MAG: hypothetical protein EOP07_05870 [Proteobacteria bacterium]|nr:MAG: hypothetical protein EOP07_05870 [Pseudomonadota bacterium]